MKLIAVKIKNYRSIADLDLGFEPKCRILVGINESGKTNILNALNLLDPQKTTTRRDLREAGRDEARITDAYVRFVFTFSDEESLKMTEDLKSKVLAKTYSSPIISDGNINYTLERFCKTRQGLYKANVMSHTKASSVWSLDATQWTLLSPWKAISPNCPADFAISKNETEKILLKTLAFVDSSEFPGIPPDYLQEGLFADLYTHLSGLIRKRVENSLPKVLFWNYEEAQLLPARIPLDPFCVKPDSCIPLKRMFRLANISDIQKEIADAKEGGANSLTNLLRHVAQKTSTHFHETWREYDDIQFSLVTDGDDLVAGIEDKSNRYELSQRSDGFKRFVTFLLMVSAEDATNSLKDTVLLIDEPEIGLHPAGARYLLEELIDISKNNYVVFSTHSIFMVDNRVINRHLIVTKANEITTADEASGSNIQDEEVIYNSLGHSIFANLKPKNLIFEGWRDKKIFETAISRVPATYEPVKALKECGRCFTHGVKQIKAITPLFEAGDRKCLILSDSDPPAREHQREYQHIRGYGLWRRYDEILPGVSIVTGEDFIKDAKFEDPLDDLSTALGIPRLPVGDFNSPAGKIHIIKQWLGRNHVEQELAAQAIEGLKEAIFDDLKYSEIKTEYYDYLTNLLPIVQGL